MKNRIAYLVISKNDNKSSIYTDYRKVKRLINDDNSLEIYMFKSTSKGRWENEYKLNYDGTESQVEMLKDNNYYSDLGCFIMESIAKAEWCSSIKYPDNGWHICSICGDITNDIGKCLYCGDFVCWDCANDAVSSESDFCSYDCYRLYCEEEYDIPYNPEEEYKDKIYNRLEYILEHFEIEELLNILVTVKSNTDDEKELYMQKYKDMNEKKLLSILNNSDSGDICDVLIEIYEDKTDDYLSDLLDAESFVNNLDPDDPADSWFFED
ncbi:MAG TPA: hypothetical protein DEG71_02435 [Clostridiales bacterium]|nr:hypothetical protein [Clostridiales bacterium]